MVVPLTGPLSRSLAARGLKPEPFPPRISWVDLGVPPACVARDVPKGRPKRKPALDPVAEAERKAAEADDRSECTSVEAEIMGLPNGQADEPIPAPTVERIVKFAALVFGIPVIDIKSHRREKGVVVARQICIYLICRLTPRTLPEIGMLMGGRDHTTILYSQRKIASRMLSEPDFAKVVEWFVGKLGGDSVTSSNGARSGFGRGNAGNDPEGGRGGRGDYFPAGGRQETTDDRFGVA